MGEILRVDLSSYTVDRGTPDSRLLTGYIGGSGLGNEIKLFFLPSYSSDLNPDECLNCDLKDGVY